jgi:hypothetical protein
MRGCKLRKQVRNEYAKNLLCYYSKLKVLTKCITVRHDSYLTRVQVVKFSEYFDRVDCVLRRLGRYILFDGLIGVSERLAVHDLYCKLEAKCHIFATFVQRSRFASKEEVLEKNSRRIIVLQHFEKRMLVRQCLKEIFRYGF